MDFNVALQARDIDRSTFNKKLALVKRNQELFRTFSTPSARM
jgi:hypothetical protein